MSCEIFERVCESLEERTDLSRLEARGTIRLTLKEAGLDPARVTPHQMGVAISEILPAELRSRGVDDADAVCEALGIVAKTVEGDATVDAADRIDGLFRRTL